MQALIEAEATEKIDAGRYERALTGEEFAMANARLITRKPSPPRTIAESIGADDE